MHSAPFTLVCAEDHTKIVAFGLEIIKGEGEGEIEATITYRSEPGGQNMFGVHTSAEAARDRYSFLTPVTLLRGGGRQDS